MKKINRNTYHRSSSTQNTNVNLNNNFVQSMEKKAVIQLPSKTHQYQSGTCYLQEPKSHQQSRGFEREEKMETPQIETTKQRVRVQSNFHKESRCQGQYCYDTVTNGFEVQRECRPQSKQQSRAKVASSADGKRKAKQPTRRPQTSKGNRAAQKQDNLRGKKLIEGVNEVTIPYKRTLQSAKPKIRQQLQLQTSIDPEFLALFAS